MAANAKGIDVSSHQGIVDWAAVRAAGMDFVMVKATEGDGYISPYYIQHWQGAHAAGLLRCAYHFFRWDIEPGAQAAHFLSTVAGDFGELGLAVDIEQPGDGAGFQGYPITEAQRRVRLFVDTVKAATGKAPLIYTYPYAWQVTMGNALTFGDCPLWLADYTPPITPPPSWSEYTFLQTGTRGSVGGEYPVDTDIFKGDRAALRKWAGLPEDVYTDPLTGYTVQHGFLDLWKARGGVGGDGRPLGNEALGGDPPFSALPELRGYVCQLFERAFYTWRPGEQAQPGRVGALVEALAKGK